MASPAKPALTLDRNTIPNFKNGFYPATAAQVLERKSFIEKPNLTGKPPIEPDIWQTYFSIKGSAQNTLTDDEMSGLQACFLALNNVATHITLIDRLSSAYYSVWGFAARKGKTGGIGITKTDKVFDPLRGEYRTFDGYINTKSWEKGVNGSIIDDIADIQAGAYLLGGAKAKLSSKITMAAVDFARKIASETKDPGFVTNIDYLTNDIKLAIKNTEEIKNAIAGVSTEIISAKDLLKARTQLYTPEQLKDPKVQAQLQEMAQSEAKLEEEKRKQAQLMDAELGKINVFDPYIGALASENVANYKSTMKSYGNKSIGDRKLNQSFIPPKPENNPLENLKDAQMRAAFPKRPIGRPKGSNHVAKYNAFIEQRSLNRIKKNFSRVDELAISSKMESQKTKPENFTRVDHRMGNNLVDHKDNSFKTIDPAMNPTDRRSAIRFMLFGE